MNAQPAMTQAKWNALTPSERDAFRDNSDLSPQLVGLEGWRVEVIDDKCNARRRFIVGKSTGWRPCHLEIKTRRSLGGSPARKQYASVRRVEQVH